MKCAIEVALLAYGATAFIAPALMQGQHNFSSGVQRRHQPRRRSGIRELGEASLEAAANGTLGALNEEPSSDSDAFVESEIEELIHSLGASQTAGQPREARKSEVDETRVIMALRKKMGDEDFYAIFDPKNFFIGEL